MLYPILTELPPAPSDLLKVIKCSCTGTCDNLRCSCRKNGIQCSIACKNCKGLTCKNAQQSHECDSEDDEVNVF